MASRVKEDEKNEKIIRGLLKLPANKKCINCNSLGPQYVCTNFAIFICTHCSGIHREFTHRVKSISMSKFSTQEVKALQEGGNERAKEVFFKEWDPQRHSFPDSSNVEKLRDFIKHVYVDRRYAGERSTDKNRRPKNDGEDFDEHKRPNVSRGSSRSPAYEEVHDRQFGQHPGSTSMSDIRSSKYGTEERQSPGYDQGDYKRSPGGDDRSGKKFEGGRFSDGVNRIEGRSPDYQIGTSKSSSPIVRPVRDILGEDAPALRVGEPPKLNGIKPPEVPSKKITSSSSVKSTEGNPAETKAATLGSLIDFSTDLELPNTSATPSVQSVPQQASNPGGENWASFDFSTEQKAPEVTSKPNSLESALFQLSASENDSISNAPGLTSAAVNLFPRTTDVPSATVKQSQPSPFSSVSAESNVPQSFASPFASPVFGTSFSQSWASPIATNAPGVAASAGLISGNSALQGLETNNGHRPQPDEPQKSGRQEIPPELFNYSIPNGVPSYQGWQARPPYGTGYGKFPTTAQQQYSYASKSTNPFDLASEPTSAHPSMFPSMAPMQEALPTTTNPSRVFQNSSFGTASFPQILQHQHLQPSSFQQSSQSIRQPVQPFQSNHHHQQHFQSIPQQQPYQALNQQQFHQGISQQQHLQSVSLQRPFQSIPQQQQLFEPLSMPYGGYMLPRAQHNMTPQVPGNTYPTGNQGMGYFGDSGSVHSMPRGDARYSQPSNSNPFPSAGGNPFG